VKYFSPSFQKGFLFGILQLIAGFPGYKILEVS